MRNGVFTIRKKVGFLFCLFFSAFSLQVVVVTVVVVQVVAVVLQSVFWIGLESTRPLSFD